MKQATSTKQLTMNEQRYQKSWLARLLRLDYGVSPTSVHRAKGHVPRLPERVRIPRVALMAAKSASASPVSRPGLYTPRRAENPITRKPAARERDACLDVPLALGDISFQLCTHLDAGTLPSRAELAEWLEWINDAKFSHLALQEACEDIVECGATTERVAKVEKALACCQGQDEYWRREDRW
ncbi:MAG TPA: hypothetical protein PLX09_02595 [Xanthomonadaceae bacterium]|nr:hypothetical protein [Xanthomonadaceae bacterium]